MKISRKLLEEMVGRARLEYPYECCGILASKDDKVVAIHPLTNVDKSSVTYLADGAQQLAAIRAVEDASLTLAAIYHSHPFSPCYPSQRDVNMAYYPDAAYVIISLLRWEDPEVKAFRIVDGIISPSELVIEEGD